MIFILWKTTMTKAQELAEMIDGREYRDETTDDMVQFAKENNLMICTGSSDDNVTLYWAFEEEVGISRTWDFNVSSFVMAKINSGGFDGRTIRNRFQ